MGWEIIRFPAARPGSFLDVADAHETSYLEVLQTRLRSKEPAELENDREVQADGQPRYLSVDNLHQLGTSIRNEMSCGRSACSTN